LVPFRLNTEEDGMRGEEFISSGKEGRLKLVEDVEVAVTPEFMGKYNASAQIIAQRTRFRYLDMEP